MDLIVKPKMELDFGAAGKVSNPTVLIKDVKIDFQTETARISAVAYGNDAIMKARKKEKGPRGRMTDGGHSIMIKLNDGKLKGDITVIIKERTIEYFENLDKKKQ